ncbi:MAG TPA: chromosomal replication initiator protein DnaA, partial [Longimicrobiaceae bacterium]|nr:chromosomal replication initiator protein DnaA [Longimicrobiaceae bacterium]
ADWVEDKYGELLSAIGEQLFDRRFTLSVQVQGNNGRAQELPLSAAPAQAPAAAPSRAYPTDYSASAPEPRPAPGLSPLNERYTFDRFVVGNNNQLASAAAHAVAEAPARMYNPLFIYGGVGLGKTHLMHAIGHTMLARDPGKRVMYLSSERFTNELVSAIQEGSMAEFRRQYRQMDLLLVDDIQFLEGKERTQEEFFHTFNALHDAQKQIVLTSDRPPKEIGLEDRLISRFEWGLVADIKPPDFETRMAILRKKMEEEGLQMADADEVLTYIAQTRTSSVRELEGAVTKLFAHSSLYRREISVEFAREVLGGGGHDGRSEGGGITPDVVRQRVAAAWGVTTDALQSKKRTKDLTVPRQVAMYLIKELFDLQLVEIGKLFGGRDHSTVIHSIAKVEEDMATDPVFRERVDGLRAALR